MIALRGFLRKRLLEKKEKRKMKFKMWKPKKLTVVPPPGDVRKVNLTYPLIEPYAYAQIRWSEEEKSLIYRVVEPSLSEREKDLYKRIVHSLIEIIDIELSAIKKGEEVLRYIEKQTRKIIDELGLELTDVEFGKIMYYIYRNFVGLDEIEPLMHDPYIEDIGCDGVKIPLYVVHKKFGSVRTNIEFKEIERLGDFVVKLAERCGRYVSYAEPLLDGSLPDGSRVQATIARDVTTKGPTFSIRKFGKEPFSPTQMITFGTASPALLAYLWYCIQNGSSILICGGVAAGKTSFLNAISLFIPPEYKIVSIEDTRELNLPHENWIPAQVRVGFGARLVTGRRYGEVTMFDLLKESFRQNPDYVVVGEVRGEEAYVMFQGMASGNPSMGTIHAGGTEDVVKRLQSPPIELSPALIETLDLVIMMVHAREKGKADRRVQTIEEIVSVERDRAVTNKVWSWVPATDTFEFRGGEETLRKISEAKGIPLENIKEELEKRAKVLEWATRTGIKNWRDVAKLISEYYRNPAAVWRRAGIR
jgi:flagellar protein FlaI